VNVICAELQLEYFRS